MTYSSLKQFNTKTGMLSIASSAGTLCCVADTIYHMVMKSGAISKLISKEYNYTSCCSNCFTHNVVYCNVWSKRDF